MIRLFACRHAGVYPIVTIVGLSAVLGPAPSYADDLAAEVRTRGWIVYSSRTDRGDWDLFRMRPDGSAICNLTQTQGCNEGGAQFSPDGRRLLYYRMPVETAVDNNKYGLHDLVLARADGTQPVVWGNQYPWASWGPSTHELACLTPGGIRLVDVESRQELRKLSRRGIVQQLVWSPDGRWFTGTANGLGIAWCVGVLNAGSTEIRVVTETDRYNCTPDWWPDAEAVIYSRGIVPGAKGRAQLWQGYTDGRPPRLLVAEDNRHLYGGCVSQDGAYILFTRSEQDLGEVDISKTTMAICRMTDTPLLIGPGGCDGMRERYPDARSGPVLDLPRGWEPDWTYAQID
ncbi:MAG: hypothetical protein ABFE13_24555 [Phycisphaerales bacterium]